MTRPVFIHALESFGFTIAAAAVGWGISYLPHMEALGAQYLIVLPVLTAALRAVQKWLEERGQR